MTVTVTSVKNEFPVGSRQVFIYNGKPRSGVVEAHVGLFTFTLRLDSGGYKSFDYRKVQHAVK